MPREVYIETTGHAREACHYNTRATGGKVRHLNKQSTLQPPHLTRMPREVGFSVKLTYLNTRRCNRVGGVQRGVVCPEPRTSELQS